MYNPRLVGSPNNYETMKCVAHGAIKKNDFVTLKTDGQAEVTAAGNAIFGVALEAASGAGKSFTVLRVSPGVRFIMDNDNIGTTFAATHVGARFDMIGNSGEMLVDTSTVAQLGTGADTGQLFCVEYNPKGFGLDDDTSIGVFEVAEIQGLTA